MIGQASKDENGTYKNGKSGDQTKVEVYIRTWYNRPWSHVIRFNDATMREKVAICMEHSCNNNLIGYDQNQRNTLLTQARKVGYDPAKVTVACETDCSADVSLCCMYAGIPESVLYKDGNSCTTSNLRSRLLSTGKVTVLTDSKYRTGDSYLLRGDILLYEGHHVAVNLTNGSKTTSSTPVTNPSTTTTATTSSSDLISIGKVHAKNFINQSNTSKNIDTLTLSQLKAMVLQRAINLDYNAKLVLDGAFGSRSKSALGAHYVSKGEKQYMVTCAEILMYLNNKNPNGVELPATFDDRLVKASGKTKITASDFLSYIK